MGAMDVLVNEVDSKFGLGVGKAGSLLTAILSLIQDKAAVLLVFWIASAAQASAIWFRNG